MDYDFSLKYLPKKKNVVADTLSRMMLREEQLLEEFRDLGLEISMNPKSLKINALKIKNELEDQILEAMSRDPYIDEIKESMTLGKATDFQFTEKGLLKFQERVYIPNVNNLKECILNEAHSVNTLGITTCKDA